MLQELLDRVFSGSGIDVTVIEIPIARPAGDPDRTRTLSLLDELAKARSTVKQLCEHHHKQGYHYQESRLRQWLDHKIADVETAMDTVSKLPDDADAETFGSAFDGLKVALERVVPDVTAKLKAMIDRHKIAICEVEVADLLT